LKVIEKVRFMRAFFLGKIRYLKAFSIGQIYNNLQKYTSYFKKYFLYL
jgi:hypothetical protein